MLLEVIATTLKDVRELNQMDVDRIELCEEMDKDGLTPGRELIQEAIRESGIPVNVMVRPHDDSFSYSANEIDQMVLDIEFVKSAGANGIVIGAVTKEGLVDISALEKLIAAAGNMEVTFHKAFDEIEDQMEALRTLNRYSEINTVLTSGGAGSSINNIEQLKLLVYSGKESGITVMPGGGLNLENAEEVCDTVKPSAIHFGTGVREDGSFNSSVSEEKINRLNQIFSGR